MSVDVNLTEQTRALGGEFLSIMASDDPKDLARLREILHEDFIWYCPASMEDPFGLPGGEEHGFEGLRDVTNLDKAIYMDANDTVEGANTTFHFAIAENNYYIVQFETSCTCWEGSPYHNVYCMVLETRDGKVYSFREHADTKQCDAWGGTPEKLAAVKERLKKLRAGEPL